MELLTILPALDDFTWAQIFAHLFVRDLVSAQGVCRRWRAIIGANRAFHSPLYLALTMNYIERAKLPEFQGNGRDHCEDIDWNSVFWRHIIATATMMDEARTEQFAIIRAHMNLTDVREMLRAFDIGGDHIGIRAKIISVICAAHSLEHDSVDEPIAAAPIVRKCGRFCAKHRLRELSITIYQRAIVAAYYARIRGKVRATWLAEIMDRMCAPVFHFAEFLVHLYHISHASSIFTILIDQVCSRDFDEFNTRMALQDTPIDYEDDSFTDDCVTIPQILSSSGYDNFARELLNEHASEALREWCARQPLSVAHFVRRAKKAAQYRGEPLSQLIGEFATHWMDHGATCIAEPVRRLHALMIAICREFARAQNSYTYSREYRYFPLHSMEKLIDPFQFLDGLLTHQQFGAIAREWIMFAINDTSEFDREFASIVTYLRQHYAYVDKK